MGIPAQWPLSVSEAQDFLSSAAPGLTSAVLPNGHPCPKISLDNLLRASVWISKEEISSEVLPPPSPRAPRACPRRPLFRRGSQSPDLWIRLQRDARCLSAAGSWGCRGPLDWVRGGGS
ncbi:uncharacterized protein [Eschrichtius robustus]|uniref:uncharacterized protein isoform X2 n=1 Tax=Eschrichtius robustus TaxID=9764 RepID=UPI0035BEC614